VRKIGVFTHVCPKARRPGKPDRASPRGQPPCRKCDARPHRLRLLPWPHPRHPCRERGI